MLREAAARALGQIDDTRAADPLTVALRDPCQRVREDAAGALKNLG